MKAILIALGLVFFVASSSAYTDGKSCIEPHVISPDAALASSQGQYKDVFNVYNVDSNKDKAVINIQNGECMGWSDETVEKVFYASWSPSTTVSATISVTDAYDNATWATKVMVVGDVAGAVRKCNASNFKSGLDWTCEFYQQDMCQGYPNPAPIYTFGAGRTYTIIFSATSPSAEHFTLVITKNKLAYTETWDTTTPGQLPTGWSFTGHNVSFVRSWYVASAANHSVDEFNVSAAQPVSPLGSNIVALQPLINDPATRKQCEDSNWQFCKHDNDTLTSPEIDASGLDSVILSFDTLFFDGRTPLQNIPEAAAYIDITIDNGANWIPLGKLRGNGPNDEDKWYTAKFDITSSAAGKSFRVRFGYRALITPPTVTWAINNIQVYPASSWDMCADDYSCTVSSCSISAAKPGCQATPNNTVCHLDYPDCLYRTCNVTAPGHDNVTGCDYRPIPNACDDGLSCTNDVCDATRGSAGCTYTPVAARCDDGRGCTVDTCVNKTNPNFNLADATTGCYYKIDCDDQVYCTVDTCENATLGGDRCLHTVDYNLCDDGIDCTYELTCDAEHPELSSQKGCVRISMDNWCDDGDNCTIDSCNPQLKKQDSCVHEPMNCDDCLECTVDYCENGVCHNVANHSLCDDGFACTIDTCDKVLGRCTNIVNHTICSAGADECFDYECNPYAHGADAQGCVAEAINCDDSLVCTHDTCSNGVCVHTANNTLCDDNRDCTDDVCNVGLGKCTNHHNDSNCGDSDPCTINFCGQDGNCATEAVDCADDIPCTHDFCNATGCVHEANHTACDDGYACTVDVCDVNLGRCTNTPYDAYCDTISNSCYNNYCNVLSGDNTTGCVAEAIDCDDDIFCTHDFCNETTGQCEHPAFDSDCDDGHVCTADICDVNVGQCTNFANNSACDDSNACSTDSCGADGECHHDWKECYDEIACTVDVCNSTTGQCEFYANDSYCDDGIDCTVDFCDVVLGRCSNIAYNSRCPPISDCTEGHCSVEEGECVYEYFDEMCDDSIDCTVDTCRDGTLGCANVARNYLCDDGVGCTQDICSSTTGCSNTPMNAWCDDNVTCTVDVCSAKFDCQIRVNHSACNDGIDCTVDRCSASDDCVFKPVDMRCSDGIACTIDTCDPSNATNSCKHEADDSVCDPGWECATASCSLTEGCTTNDTACPWHTDDKVCINCLTNEINIHQNNWRDETGAMSFLFRDAETEEYNTLLAVLPTGQTILGGSPNNVPVRENEGVIVNGNLRLVPKQRGEELEECNEVRRGTLAVVEEPFPCGEGFCHRDVLYVCLKGQTYEWKTTASDEDY